MVSRRKLEENVGGRMETDYKLALSSLGANLSEVDKYIEEGHGAREVVGYFFRGKFGVGILSKAYNDLTGKPLVKGGFSKPKREKASKKDELRRYLVNSHEVIDFEKFRGAKNVPEDIIDDVMEDLFGDVNCRDYLSYKYIY